MASPESGGGRRLPGESEPAPADINLSRPDRGRLLNALAAVYFSPAEIRLLLRRIGYPASRVPALLGSSAAIWHSILTDLENGIIAAGNRRLLSAALRDYPGNSELSRLAATYLSGTPAADRAAPVPLVRDIELSAADRQDLLAELASVFRADASIEALLFATDFPRSAIPSFIGSTSADIWRRIAAQIENGIIPEGYRRLLTAVIRVYANNPVFARLAAQYLSRPPEAAVPPPGASAPGAELAGGVGVVVRAETEDDRQAAEAALRVLGLAPAEMWSTAQAVSYLVQADDMAAVRLLLRGTDLSYSVVPADQAHLLATLYVVGPDGRRFRFTDIPAQQTVGDLAFEVGSQYETGPARPAVVDRVGSDGRGTRLSPDDTLGEALFDGDTLRVGFEARAAGPVLRSSEPAAPPRPADSGYLEQAIEQVFEEAGLSPGAPPLEVLLVERSVAEPPIELVRLSVARAQAALELHRGYYTYYWKSRIGVAQFVSRLRPRQDPAASVTLVDRGGTLQQLPLVQAADIFARFTAEGYAEQFTLVRFDGPDSSWVWQLASPGPPSHAQASLGDPYIGCASTARHLAHFAEAGEHLADTAVDGEHLARSTHLFEHYITRWERARWEPQLLRLR